MRKKLLILIAAFIGLTTMHSLVAQTYDLYDVQVINNLITNNGLDATPDAPETWKFLIWNNNTPKQIRSFVVANMFLHGNVSLAGLPSLFTIMCYDQDKIISLDLTGCEQLESVQCAYNKQLIKFYLTGCTQLKQIHCAGNQLTELDLTGLDSIKNVNGPWQSVSLTLSENETGEYTHSILLNNPTFENSAISYSEGILKSTDNTVGSTSFTVQTIGGNFQLSGTMFFSYTNGINIPKKIELKVYPNPTTGELKIENGELTIKNIEVFDVTGRRQKVENRKDNVFDISHLSTGVYFVKIFTEAGQTTKKIIKQ